MATQNQTNIQLSELAIGQRAVISQIHNDMDPIVKQRLIALGFVVGSIIEVVRRAPFGDPTEFRVRGSRISLRKSESKYILTS